MTITANKIIKYILLLGLVTMIVVLGYYFTGKQRLFTGDITLVGANASYVDSVQFNNPKNTVYPTGNSVTIDSVYVDFKDCLDFDSTTCPTSASCSVGAYCAGVPLCSDFGTDEEFCTLFGCTWSGTTCGGGQIMCENITQDSIQALCELVSGCSWSDSTNECTGSTSCASINLSSLCSYAGGVGCHFNGSSCVGDATCNLLEYADCGTTDGCAWITNACLGDFDYQDGVIASTELSSSFISFECTDGDSETAGVQTCDEDIQILNNVITVPDSFTPFSVDIFVPDGSDLDTDPDKVNTDSLIIAPQDCSSLQTSIMKGQGTGMFTGDPEDLPKAATSVPFKFDNVSDDAEGESAVSNINLSLFYSGIRDLSKIVIENPVATGTTLGSKEFTLTVDFLATIPDTATDAIIYDIGTCNMNTYSNCTIKVKEEGATTPQITTTAANFAAAINAIPFRAFGAISSSTNITLTATEIGSHTNNYTVSVTMANNTTTYCDTFDPDTDGSDCGDETLDVCVWNASTCKSECLVYTEEQCIADENCEFNGADCIVKNPVTIISPTPFSGGQDPVYDPVESVILSYPTTTVTGAQTFNITVNFDEDFPENPVIASSSGDGNYVINARDEGVSDTAGTAANFAYVFNHTLGANSPFAASIDSSNSSWIVLTTRELGEHTNDYICNVDGTAYPSLGSDCFTDGEAGKDGVDVLTTPLTLDNKMNQGDTAMVYIMGSLGENEWTSSHPSILEVALLSEVADGATESSAEFLTAPLSTTGTYSLNSGTYTVSGCEPEYDTSDPPVLLQTTCDITMSIPVSFSVPAGLHALANVGGETVTVALSGDASLTGMITGSGTWSSNTVTGGFNQTLTGTVTGTVTGYATDTAEGMVHGTIKADVSGNAQLLATLTPSNLGISSFPIMGAVTPTTQLTADGTFTSTVTAVESVTTNQAVLYAKRPGTSILTVTDAQNCTAALEVQVVGQRVIIQMVDKDPGEVFEVGETVNLKAYRGTTEGEIIEEITSEPGIEWASSNQDVATVDATGILTAVAPGVTNITAKYATGETEIGEITSAPLAITVNKVTGLIIVLDKATQNIIPIEERNQAYESVDLAINNPQAVGGSITVEGQPISITLPDPDGTPYTNDIEKVEAIAANIKSQIPDTVDVTQSTANPGMLTLVANEDNTNGIVDITSTSPVEKVTILPYFPNNIDLPATRTYSLMVLAGYANGKTKLLAPTASGLTWVNTPAYLDTAVLPSGILKFSENTGTSAVQAIYENGDGSSADSNVLNVTIQAGPVIEYLNRIGVGSIVKGGEVILEMLVSDIDTIADIQDFNIKIVDATNPANIFDSTAFTDLGDFEEVTDGGEGEGEGDEEPASLAPYYRIYTVPVTIPDSALLYDGNYFISITITDTSANSYKYDLPIYIGTTLPGNVDGIGGVNFADVYRAFQIYNGSYTPTLAERQAADIALPKDGNINFADIYAIFQLITQS